MLGTLFPLEQGLRRRRVLCPQPVATRLDDRSLVDRNKDCLVLHGTFQSVGDTKVLFGGDIHYEELEEIVRITRYHGREERIENDIVKIPHHCSYTLSDQIRVKTALSLLRTLPTCMRKAKRQCNFGFVKQVCAI